jgi:hypothetical protein
MGAGMKIHGLKMCCHTWIPFVTSTTRIMRSMIWAPPMIVRMSEAWPGQSTRVNCSSSAYTLPTKRGGSGTVNDEKPKSRVIPLSLL